MHDLDENREIVRSIGKVYVISRDMWLDKQNIFFEIIEISFLSSTLHSTTNSFYLVLFGYSRFNFDDFWMNEVADLMPKVSLCNIMRHVMRFRIRKGVSLSGILPTFQNNQFFNKYAPI